MGTLKITKWDAEGNLISEEEIDTEAPKKEKSDGRVKRSKKRKPSRSDDEELRESV